MQQEYTHVFKLDADGNPAGGHSIGEGISITWQNGPLGRGDERQLPNGAFVETLIAIAKDRLEWYQTESDGRFACQENADAMQHLHMALSILNQRTARREVEGTEGTHTPDRQYG